MRGTKRGGTAPLASGRVGTDPIIVAGRPAHCRSTTREIRPTTDRVRVAIQHRDCAGGFDRSGRVLDPMWVPAPRWRRCRGKRRPCCSVETGPQRSAVVIARNIEALGSPACRAGARGGRARPGPRPVDLVIYLPYNVDSADADAISPHWHQRLGRARNRSVRLCAPLTVAGEGADGPCKLTSDTPFGTGPNGFLPT